MKVFSGIVICLLALVVAAGCASTKVSDREMLVTEKIPRPDHIWVHDFAATSAEVPGDSAIAGQNLEHGTPQTPEHIAMGRKLGAQIAVELVREIREMGMPVQLASGAPSPKINDIVIRGYLLSFDEGDAKKRVAVGFGSGASHLTVAAEGFQVTAHGLRKLGGGKVDSGGGKAPGGAVGVAAVIATGNPVGLIVGGGAKAYGEYSGSAKVEGRAKAVAKEIADALRKRFQEQGWIQ